MDVLLRPDSGSLLITSPAVINGPESPSEKIGIGNCDRSASSDFRITSLHGPDATVRGGVRCSNAYWNLSAHSLSEVSRARSALFRVAKTPPATGILEPLTFSNSKAGPLISLVLRM